MSSRRSLAALVLAGVAAALMAASVTLASPPEGRFTDATRLTGAEEIPGPGDPDGSGLAVIRGTREGEICYRLRVKDIAPATAAHIHIGSRGQAGPVVQGLAPPTEGSSAACVSVAPALAAAIDADPSNYYVNIHNAQFPAGALRGQLGK